MSVERLKNARFGIFNHYLNRFQNNPAEPTNQGVGHTSWEECTSSLDVEKLAANVARTGAGFYFITVMQGERYMIAPNATFDAIAGTKPGEACAKRDLIAELYDALTPYGIDLYLYFTGDGPYKDPQCGPAFGFTEPREVGVTMPFVKKWASVLEEYAVRYGDKIKGWWIDGCYRDFLKYDDALMEPYYLACKKGNPDCVVAMNNGVKPYHHKNYVKEDFVCGEFNDFLVVPPSSSIDGAQAFTLAPIGKSDVSEWDAWGGYGVKRSGEYLHHFIRCVNEAGGVVAIDMALNRDGSFEENQFREILKIK